MPPPTPTPTPITIIHPISSSIRSRSVRRRAEDGRHHQHRRDLDQQRLWGDVGATDGPGVPIGQTWTSVASNSDSSILEATTDNDGSIWRSTDGGVNCSHANSPLAPAPASWTSVSTSSTGSCVLAADQGGQLWLSSDGGLTWTAQTQPGASGVGNWTSVSVSNVSARVRAGGLLVVVLVAVVVMMGMRGGRCPPLLLMRVPAAPACHTNARALTRRTNTHSAYTHTLHTHIYIHT